MNFLHVTTSTISTMQNDSFWINNHSLTAPLTYSNGTTPGGNVNGDGELDLSFKIAIGCFMLFMILVGFLGNFVVCFIVIQKPAMRSAINLLLANMAVSNILTSLMSMTYSFLALFWSSSILTNTSCSITMFVQEVYYTVAISMLLTISVDRYQIIVRKRDKLLSKNARKFIVLAWIFAAIVAFPPTVGWGRYGYSPSPPQCVLGDHNRIADVVFVLAKIIITYFFPVLIMGFCFCRILNVFHKNRYRVHNQNDMEFTISVISSRGKLGLPILQRSLRASVDMGFKTRAFRTILTLFIVYLICWTPYAVNTLVCVTRGDCSRTRNVLFLWTGYTNSVINPIIYCIRIQKFRQACRSLMPDTITLTHGLFSFTKRRVNPVQVYQFTEPSSS